MKRLLLNSMRGRALWPVLCSVAFLVLVWSCARNGGDPAPSTPTNATLPVPSNGDSFTPPAPLRTFLIAPGADAYRKAQEALIAARPGDAICFAAGTFEFDRTLTVEEVSDITLCGAGMDKTILKFTGSATDEGISAAHTDGIVIRDLTVFGTPGDGIKVSDSDGVTFLRTAVKWSDDDDPGSHGAYGLYPVLCHNVLVEESVSHGASDAGIYIGQSDNVIIRRSIAEFNVAGIEIENTSHADVYDNLATHNTGGILIFSHPNLAVNSGERTRIFNNRIIDNNTTNFAPGGDVQYIPRGSGVMMFSYDRIEMFGNEVRNHDGTGVLIISGRLVESSLPEGFDPYPEQVYIHDNIFNGGGDDGLSQGRLPQGSDNVTNPPNPSDPRDQGKLLVDALVTLVRAKYLANPNPTTAAQGRIWPYINWDGDINAAKAVDGRIAPANGICSQNNKDDAGAASDIGIFYPGIDQAGNVSPEQRMAERDGGLLNALAQVSADPSARPEHDCALNLGLAPIVIPPRPPVAASADDLTPEQIAALCNAAGAGVNFSAYIADCPNLASYRLFGDAHDPRSAPNSGGFPYELTTPLFSDYATKYRVLFLPPGAKAQYRDERNAPGDDDARRAATLDLPVGAIIAKTFAFKANLSDPNSAQTIVETRLLMHRASGWIGLPYVWNSDMSEALLAKSGAERTVTFTHPTRGSITTTYVVPNADQCVTCHGRDTDNDDNKDGAAPIGLKARLLNRSNSYGGAQKNQLAELQARGLLSGWDQNLATTPRLQTWDNTGDGTLEQRARAYLESNCMHCHRPGGHANLSGLYLDSFRAIDASYGICKRPTAAGQGSGGYTYDIVPRDHASSILSYRMNSVEASAKMPELAKSVVHTEGVQLINDWIDSLPASQYPGCSSGGGLPGLPALPGG